MLPRPGDLADSRPFCLPVPLPDCRALAASFFRPPAAARGAAIAGGPAAPAAPAAATAAG